MATHYWIGVVQRDHVRLGVDGGFAQVGHGKGGPLRRMSAGDWLFYYSPRTSLDGEKLQAFTAAGRIAEGDVYQVEMTSDFHPWRRNVAYVEAVVEAPIEPLKGRSFPSSARTETGGWPSAADTSRSPSPTLTSSPARWASR